MKKNLSHTKLPKSITVMGTKYLVKEKYELTHNSTLVDGLYDPNAHTIWVNKGLPQTNKWHALFHEIGHGVMEENSINQSLSDDMEHIIVEAYAKLLVRLFV